MAIVGHNAPKRNLNPGPVRRKPSLISRHNAPKRNLNEVTRFSVNMTKERHNAPKRNLNVPSDLSEERDTWSQCTKEEFKPFRWS